MEIAPNKVFLWKAGLCLIPRQRVFLTLPGQLVGPTEKIGDVIRLSNPGTKIGFQEDSKTKAWTRIHLEVEAGTAITLAKETEAFLRSDSNAPLVFDAGDPASE
ncbi:MAG TPA: hypothetical protein VIM58_06785 [Candidatus Methylacidiphilales bacterium]